MSILLGAITGSFLATVTANFPNTIVTLFRRSKCQNCHTKLNCFDLVPILSYFFFKGKCRYCKRKINTQYLMIEFLTALFFFLIRDSNNFCLDAVFISILIVISFIDLNHMVIPNNLLILILILSIIKNYLLHVQIFKLLVGGFSVSSILGLTYILTKGIGIGDIKLMFVVGLYLGFRQTLLSFLISSCLGGFFGIYMLSTGRLHLKSEIPYAPILSLGIVLSLIL